MRLKTLCGAFVLCSALFISALAARAQTNRSGAVTADAAHTLTDAQKQSIKRIQTDAEKQAAPAVLELAGIVSRIYENMLADRPDEKLRADLSAQMERATWALLSIKGQSIYDIVRVLTPAQRLLVKAEMQKPGAPSDLSEVVAHVFKLDDK